MRIQILLFAVYRDVTGVGEWVIDVAAGTDAYGALAELRSRDRRFSALPDRPAIAVNREYADLTIQLHEGDELALIPPVAGG
jgi:molybdopterin synthase sulfur carrier subunit